MKMFMIVLLYSILCGGLLVGFVVIDDLMSYAFGLGTFIIGLRFFRNYSTWGPRVALIATSVFFFFTLTVVFAIIAYINGWDVPALEIGDY